MRSLAPRAAAPAWADQCQVYEVPPRGPALLESAADTVSFAGATVPGVEAVAPGDVVEALPRAIGAVVVEDDERLVVLFEPKDVVASVATVRQEWTDDEVRLELLAGAGGVSVCGSRPGAAVAVELSEPLAGRAVRDVTGGVVLRPTE